MLRLEISANQKYWYIIIAITIPSEDMHTSFSLAGFGVWAFSFGSTAYSRLSARGRQVIINATRSRACWINYDDHNFNTGAGNAVDFHHA